MPTTKPTKRAKLTKEKREDLEEFLVVVLYKVSSGKDVRCKDVMDFIRDQLRNDTGHDFYDIKDHSVRSIVTNSSYFDVSKRGIWSLKNSGKLLAEELSYKEECEGIGEDIKSFYEKEENKKDVDTIENLLLKCIYMLSNQIEGQKVRSERVIKELLRFKEIVDLKSKTFCLTRNFIKFVGMSSKKVLKPSFGFWALSESTYKDAEFIFPDVIRQKYWVTVELSSLGEQKLEEGDLERIIRMHLNSPKAQLFIPSAKYVKKDALKSEIFHLIQGYIFVSSGLPLRTYLDLEDCPYVNSVFYDTSIDGQIHLKLLSNSKIEEMRSELDKMVNGCIKEGESVYINSGLYQHIEGKVISVYEKEAFVEILFKSMVILVKLPKIFLEPILPAY